MTGLTLKRFTVVFLAAFLLTFSLVGCGTTGGSIIPTSVTPTEVQSLGYDVGYLGYMFAGIQPGAQEILVAIAKLDTTQDPAALATSLQQYLSQFYASLDTSTTGQIEATAIMLAMNDLVSMLNLNQTTISDLTVSPYLNAAIAGISQGVLAAQAGLVNKALIQAARAGNLMGAQIPQLTITAPPEGVVPPLAVAQYTPGVWQEIKSSKIWIWNW